MQLPLLPSTDSWQELDALSRGTVFLPLDVRSVLNSPATTRMPFWSINPYVGCEFGCAYCYARETHRWTVERVETVGAVKAVGAGRVQAGKTVGADEQLPPLPPLPPLPALPPWLAFEKQILVKQDAANVLAATFKPAEVAGRTIVIGTATDPYQPAERHFRLTRKILEYFLQHDARERLALGIITKSPLVAR